MYLPHGRMRPWGTSGRSEKLGKNGKNEEVGGWNHLSMLAFTEEEAIGVPKEGETAPFKKSARALLIHRKRGLTPLGAKQES